MSAAATASHRNDANRRYIELEDELEAITRQLDELLRFWAALDTPNHPKRRQLTGDRIAEIERAEDDLEERYRQAFKEMMRVRREVTHLQHVRKRGWVRVSER